jgi:DNA helicase II / ATP-dependent DNA helicase PcrA
MKKASSEMKKQRVSSSNFINENEGEKSRRTEQLSAPGSGKTSDIVERCVQLVANGVKPEEILCISFAKTTVQNLQARLDLENIDAIDVTTLHAFSLKLINKNKGLLKLDDFEVLSTERATELMRRTVDIVCRRIAKTKDEPDSMWLQQLKRDPRPMIQLLEKKAASGLKLKVLLKEIKEDWPDEILKILRSVMKEYKNRKLFKSQIDFGDMLRLAKVLIDTKHDIVQQYKYLFVDEYQDCSISQAHLVAALARLIPDVFVTGDANQAVYGFGGNTYTPLSDLLDGVVEVKKNRSYRLTKQIASLAQAVLPEGEVVIETNKDGDCPLLFTHQNQRQQALQIAQEIVDLIEAGVEPTQIAVLGRTRDSVSYVEKELRACSVHVKRAAVAHCLRHATRVTWFAHLSDPSKSLKRPTAQRLQKKMTSINASPASFARAERDLLNVNAPTFEGRFQQCRDVYLRLIGGKRKNEDARTAINEWVPRCRAFENPIGLRDEIARVDAKASVTTSTIHAAKGMEWAYVFVVGLTEGVLPIHFAKTEHQQAEERRLLYVAVTRASKQLHLYHAPASNARLRKHFDNLSRYVTRALASGVLSLKCGGMAKPLTLTQRQLDF